MEEVTVSSAAQDAANTGQGAVQIRFVTRSGSNNFTGSGYYYLRHYKLNANTWFNNRDDVAKNDDMLHQPGGRIGGPIMIPGLWDGRNKAFFFVNYEQSRSPGANTENRTLLHPLAEQGIFRYTAGGADARGQRARARGRERRGHHDRPDHRPARRRHPRLHCRQHGRRHHRSADTRSSVTRTRPTASRSTRPAAST